MANMNDLNRFVKKGTVKAKKVPVKAGSWLSNAMRSVGLSARDMVSDVMPNTINLASSAVETAGEVTETLRDMKGQRGKLKQAFDANVYTKLAKDGLKNALEDLKTGDFYNQKRFEKYTSDYMDSGMDGIDIGVSSSDDNFGFDDFDFDDSDEDFDTNITSDDDGATASVKRSSNGKNELTQISMSNNIGPDSPLVQSVNFSSQVTAKATGVIVDANSSNTKVLATLMSTNSMASLKALTQINDSIVSVNDGISEIVSKHNALAEQYYSDSMAALNRIADSVTILQNNSMASILANTAKDPKDVTNLLDMFNGGVLDRSAYASYVKKNINRFADENMFISQIKGMLEQTDALGSIMAAPLRFITEDIAKQVIPKVVQTSMARFDDMLGEFAVNALTKIGSLQGSTNPVFDAIGKIFGINNKMNTKVDKTQYEKGAVPFDGITHRTINDVIPTYLRQITAALTGKEEFAFDYNKGQFRTLRSMQEDRDRDDLYARTSSYNDYINNFKEVLNKTVSFATEQDRKTQEDNFVRALDALTKKGGVSSFRLSTNKEGEVYDPLVEELGIDKKTARLMRAWAEGHVSAGDYGYISKLFGRAPQEARAAVSELTARRTANPIEFNDQYFDNGLASFNNSGIIFGDKNKGTSDRYAEVSGIIDIDKHGHKPTYYLREIYRTLLGGVGIYPLEGGFGGGLPLIGNGPSGSLSSAARSRNASALDSFKRESDKSDSKYRAKTKANPKYQSDITDKGKLNGDADYNDEQLGAAAMVAVQEVNEQQRASDNRSASIFERLAGGNSTVAKWARGFNKGVGNVSKTLQSGLDAGAELMFDVIFGNKDGKKGFGAVVDFLISGMKMQFSKLFKFVDEKIFKRVDEALFGKEGLFTKLKESELVKDLKSKFKAGKDALTEALFGTKITNPDGSTSRSGGLFGNVATELSHAGDAVKDAIFGKKDPDGKSMPVDADDSVVGAFRKIGRNLTQSVSSTLGLDSGPNGKAPQNMSDLIKIGVDSVWKNTKTRFNEWTDSLLGTPSTGDHKNKARDFVDSFRADMKGKGGKVGAGAVMGAVGAPIISASIGGLGSIFLPGGPIGGAILGAGLSFVNQSDTLKNALFGPKDDTGKRTGGIISKDVQKFFKDHGKGIKIGAGVGTLSGLGLLPWLWLPGGPIGGAILGAGLSMVKKSGALDRFLYGEGGTKDDPTGGLLGKFKSIFGKNKNLKQVGLDAASGAGIGLIGSFFLPGGPITGALLGSAASIVMNTNKFKDFLFGKEELDANGNATGKRSGGLFGKFTGYLQDKIFAPLADTAALAQAKFLHFMETKVALPLQVAVAPIVNKFKEFGESFMEGFRNMFGSIKEAFQKNVIKPIGETIDKWLLKPIKNLAGSIFKAFTSILGGIISAPFAAIGAIGKGIFESDKKRGADAASKEQLQFGFTGAKNAIKERGLFGGASLALMNIASGIKGAVNPEIRKAGAYSDKGASAYATETDNPDTLRDQLQAEADARYKARVADIDVGSKRRRSLPEWLNDIIPHRDTKGPGEVKAPEGFNTKAPKGETGNGESNTDSAKVKIDNATQAETVKDISSTTVDIKQSLSDFKDSVLIKLSEIRDSIFGERHKNDNTKPGKNRKSPGGGSGYEPSSSTNDVRLSDDNQSKYSPKRDIAADVRDIADSVHGQLNGVGLNVNKIYKILLKKNGLTDDDIVGDNNKAYLGFFGKLRTAFNRPFKVITNIITSPFKLIGATISGIANAFVNTAKSIKAGAVELVKGFAQAGLSLLEIPVNITRIGLELVKSIGPAFGQFLWQGVKLVGNALNGTVKLISTGLNGIAQAISGAAHGFGEAVGGAISAMLNLGKGLGILTKDIIGGLYKGIKTVVGGVWDVGSKIVGGAINGGLNLIGGIANAVTGKIDIKGALGLARPVYVVGGFLDKVKKVNEGTVRVEGGYLDYVSENRAVTFSKETQKDHGDLKTGLDTIISILRNGYQPNTAPAPSSDSKKATVKSGGGSYKMNLQLFGDSHEAQVARGSANALRAQYAAEDAEEKKEETQLVIADTLKSQFKQDKKQNIEWNKVFSLKTGIITLGAIALVNWLTKGGLAKVVGNAVSGAIKALPELIAAALKGITSLGDRNNNKEVVVDPETGLPVTDEDGKAKVVDRNGSVLNALTPTESYVDTETGKIKTERRWRQSSTAIDNVIGTRFYKAVYGKGIKYGANRAAQVAMFKADSVVSGFFKLGSKVLSAVKDKVAAFVLKHGGTAGNTIVNFFSKLDGALSKAASNNGIIGRFTSKISSVISSMAGKTASAAVTFGLTEGAFALAGALDANPAQVFHVNAKDVNLNMQLVGRFIRGILSTSLGSIVDLIFQIINAATGTDWVCSFATMIYNLISGEGKRDDLQKAQENFQKEWQVYQKKEYDAYVKNCEANGVTPMAEDEFTAELGIKEQAYNTQQNKTKTAMMVDAGVNAVRNVKNFFTGNKTGASNEGISAYRDSQNNDETNASGDEGGQGATVTVDKDRLNNFPFLLQNDPRWGSQQYTSTGDSSQTIGSSGCGTTSMAMVLRSFGNNVSPVDTANYSLQNGYRTANSGTGWGFFRSIGGKYGLTTEDLGKDTSAVATSLAAGKPVIASMGKGTFTKSGHFIVLSGTDANGNVLVNDPASTERSQRSWPLSVFANEGKNFWAFSKDGSGSIGNTAPVDSILSTSNGSYSSNVDTTNMQGENSTSGSDSSKKSFTQLLSEFASAIFKPIGDALGISFGDDSSSSSATDFNDAASTTDANGNTISYTVDGDYVGKYVKKFESGSKGSAMISSGKGDYGGVSFGSYQFPTYGQAQASSGSNLAKFWNQYYGNQYSSTPGNNDAFKKDWTTAVEKDPAGFFNNEHKFVADLYYNPFVSKLKSAGVGDPGNNSRGAQDAAWSTAVQLGAGSAAVNKFVNAGVNESTDPEDYLKKLYEQKISTVPQTFKSSSKSVQQSVANRYNAELATLLPLAKEKGINPNVVGKGETEVNGKDVSIPTVTPTDSTISGGKFTDNLSNYSSEPNASGPSAAINYKSVRTPSYREINAPGPATVSSELMNQVVTLLTTIANEITNISGTVEGINKKPSSIGYIDNSVTNNNTTAAASTNTKPTKTYTQSAQNGRDRSGYETAKKIAKGTFALA